VKGFDFARDVQVVENKLVVRLDDPEEQNPLIIRSLVEAGASIQFVGEMRHSLEDIYLQLIHNGDETPGGKNG
jgi:ABC-2 type transport system ATP-binding protein